MLEMSDHFKGREPSGIRVAWIEFVKRDDSSKIKPYNVAIGNVSLPMHPAMIERMKNLGGAESPFKDGVVKYTTTKGFDETNQAFLNVIASSGFKTDSLYSQITTGGSQAMGLVLLGTCGKFGDEKKPVLLIDAAYTNYNSMAERLGIPTVSVRRKLDKDGKFSLPEISGIEKIIQKYNPGSIVVIPYDNPTGHFYDHKTMAGLGELAVKYNMWMISDEAYRELHYVDHDTVSIWGLTKKEVSGIEGRRISIETASKVWNACGLRIGALVTDNKDFHEKAVAENTAELCSPAIAQYIVGALAHVSPNDLKNWFGKQRDYYQSMMTQFTHDMKQKLPGVIVSSPDASIYSVVEVRDIAKKGFNALDFVMFCAKQGKVDINGKPSTLLVAPMAGFYSVNKEEKNPGDTQMRIAYVLPPEEMKQVPGLFTELFKKYEAQR